MDKPFSSESIVNITISGRAAAGATTLSRDLARKIRWKLINPGEIYRTYVKKKGIRLERTDDVSDRYHLNLDNLITEKLKNEKGLIIESWLSGFDARGIEGIFKIFVTCSDDGIRIKRLMKRDGMSYLEARTHLKIREEENLKKWEKLYGTRDIWNPKLYDLVLDTKYIDPLVMLERSLEAIGYKKR